MFKKLIATTFIMITVFMSTAYGASIDPNAITAEAAILMDGKTGQVLFEKNIHETYFPASITKIMTALLGIENSNPEDIVTMSHEAVFSIPYGAAHIALDEDEQISMNNLLYAAMLQSANEACNGIGEHISGSIEAFSDLMNKRALEAGALNTNFVNPNGLHNENHYTTAYDMAMITRDALQNPKFREIIQTMKYEIPPTNKQEEIRYLWNTHKMLKESDFTYQGTVGGKTGYTTEALNTLVTVANRDGRELIVVLLKSSSGKANYLDTTKLLNYGFDEFESFNLNQSNVYGIENFPEDVKAQITENTYLIHNSLSSDQVSGTLGSFDEDSGVQEIVIELDSENEVMPQRIGKIYLQMPIKANVEKEVSSFPWILKIILYIVLAVFIAMISLYFFVNRKYYAKKMRRRFKKTKPTGKPTNRNRSYKNY